RVEFDHFDSGGLELVEEARIGADRADPIVDDANSDAGLALMDEQIAQHLAIAAHVLEDVILEVNVAPGRANRVEHGGKGFRAIAQDSDLVAREQGTVRDDLLDGKVALERSGIRG